MKADQPGAAKLGYCRQAGGVPATKFPGPADGRRDKSGFRAAASRLMLPFAAVCLLTAGCGPGDPQAGNPTMTTGAADVVFTDVTAAAGIEFEHHNGRSGKKWLPETLGSGCAFLDFNNDDWPDVLLVNGRSWQRDPKRKTTMALYRNSGKGTFTDVTKEAGLAIEMYGMGVAVGDYDNDGYQDFYVTALEGDRLFRNQGDGTFQDVTGQAGIDNANFGTSAAWLDYDHDGRLDIFVANYVVWSPENDLWCSLDGETKSYCTPESYDGVSSRLYRNLGGGKFADLTEKAGLLDDTSKALGVALLDFDGDGRLDIFQANDTQPNKLYRNNGDGTFSDEGLASGVAFAEDGKARGAMGVDAADYDRSGRPHLLIGNFSNEMLSLYHNEGNGLFVDEAPTSAVGRASLLYLTFGAFFFDYDLDSHLDIFAANGHLEQEISRVQPKVQYEQTPLLFRNTGRGRFELANEKVGADFVRPVVARGAAYGDYDRDGDLDVLISTNNGPAYLLRNDGGNANSYLRLKLVGRESNRSGIGAVVKVRSASGKQWQTVRSGSSYCSQSELPLTFGLASDLQVETVEVLWPSGKRQEFKKIEPNRFLVVYEEAGIREGS